MIKLQIYINYKKKISGLTNGVGSVVKIVMEKQSQLRKKDMWEME